MKYASENNKKYDESNVKNLYGYEYKHQECSTSIIWLLRLNRSGWVDLTTTVYVNVKKCKQHCVKILWYIWVTFESFKYFLIKLNGCQDATKANSAWNCKYFVFLYTYVFLGPLLKISRIIKFVITPFTSITSDESHRPNLTIA